METYLGMTQPVQKFHRGARQVGQDVPLKHKTLLRGVWYNNQPSRLYFE